MRTQLLVLSSITSLAFGQAIDFESLPGGAPTLDNEMISDQYEAEFGVRFELVNPSTFEVVGTPRIAKVGAPQTAFEGCGPDTPLDDQGVGTSMLTDDGTVSGSAGTLLVSYLEPVGQAAGVIIDVDRRGNGTFEEWTIDALDDSMTILESKVITAPIGPDVCRTNFGPGDANALGFLFDRPTADIHFIVVRYTGTATSIGLAFDNFSPTTIPPPPAVTLAEPTASPCMGSTVELTAVVEDGLAGFLYQWQVSTDGQTFDDMPGEFQSTLQAPAYPGTMYRVVVTDTIQRSATSNAVSTNAQPVTWSLLVEDAPNSGTFTALSDEISPLVVNRSAEEYYLYNGTDQSFLGDVPVTTVDRAHLMLVSTTDGITLAAVLDSQETNEGGRAEMRMEVEPQTASWLVTDDPNDQRAGGNSNALRMAMQWSDGFTDGWVIGPFDETWSAEIRFTDAFNGTPDLSGLTDAAWYSGDGAVIDLPLELDRRYRVEARCGCDADVNGDTILDIFDVVAFLGLFDAQDPAGDWNGDTIFDIFDVLAYLADFEAAC